MKQYTFNIDGEDKIFDMITDWNEMNLSTFLKYTSFTQELQKENNNFIESLKKIGELSDEEIELKAKEELEDNFDDSTSDLLGILCNKKPWEIEELEPHQMFQIAEDLEFISKKIVASTEPRIVIDGVNYMHRPSINSVTVGERKIIKQAIKNSGGDVIKYTPIIITTLIRECDPYIDFITNDLGEQVEVTKFRQRPLDSMSTEGMEEFENRKKVFMEKLMVPHFTGLAEAFFLGSAE